jgi:hypothetical protein
MEEYDMVKEGTIHKLIYLLHDGLSRLGAQVRPDKLEELAFMLYHSLMRRGREFHSFKHVFSFVESDSQPLFLLAALFHDQVYYQVDAGFTSEVQALIGAFIREEKAGEGSTGKVYLQDPLPETHDVGQALRLNLTIFGLEAGAELNPFGGLNEFLSSLVMTLSLGPFLGLEDLTKIAAYIEATIPFRAAVKEGDGPFDLLARRVKTVADVLGVGFSPEEITALIQDAVHFANTDVSNFALEDPREFLDNTWDLIPETNMNLRESGVYTIRDYRKALEKMHGFFSFLDPKAVFHQYQGLPSEADLAKMKRAAENNVTTAQGYLKVKIVTIAILEALAEATGGDAPIALFMGDIPSSENDNGGRLEHYLPTVSPKKDLDPQEPVYLLLSKGRKSQSSFDIKKAPLSLFLYLKAEEAELDQYLSSAQQMFAGELSPQAYLESLDTALLNPIALATSTMVYTRQAALAAFVKE